MNIPKSNLNASGVTFSGHKKGIDKKGKECHTFFYLFDPKQYKCEVELFNIDKDARGNYSIDDEEPAEVLELPEEGIVQDISELMSLYSDDGFAYRFKLTDMSGKVSYAFDNGTLIGIFNDKESDNKYNLVLNNTAIINKNGPMQLIMPDEFNPYYENDEMNQGLRAKVLTSVRTHANKLGGTLMGIANRLSDLQKEGVSRIVGTPFTKDTISSHKYWTENAFQVSPDLGSEEDFKFLQQELFKKGINWIADAALVNEGFGGIHFSEVLRHGNDAACKNMFRTSGDIKLGILPNESEYTRMKIINAPFDVTSDGVMEKNDAYRADKPTYIQFYDERLASEEQVMSDSPMRMTTYDNKNTDNIYDITKHDHAVYPFPIEVSPDELKSNVSAVLKSGKRLDLRRIQGINTIKAITDFSNFTVETKSAAGGVTVWDGNVDIPKLNFYANAADDSLFKNLPNEQRHAAMKDFERGALSVRDYAISSGKYWTKLTADAQFEYVSTALAATLDTAEDYMSVISMMINNGLIPEIAKDTIDKEVVNNVLSGDYHSRRLQDADMRASINPDRKLGNKYSLDDYILRQAMDVPLETLPIATNLLGIITSPYIAKKANTESELGVSRYDVMKADNPNLPEKYKNTYEKMDQLYSGKIKNIIKAIVCDIPGIEKDGQVTDYGKFVISEIAPELTKYILVKALRPDADISIDENFHIDFSKVNSEDITMQSLGILYGNTPDKEAQKLIEALDSSISSMKPEQFANLKEKMESRFAHRSLNDFKVAEMIIDRTESGLGWRIDAAKDIASIDSVRGNTESMANLWNKVIDFWKDYNQAVIQVNPHAYTTAEITDLYDLFKTESSTEFENASDAERKFLQETGITAVANYNYFFSLLPDLFVEYSFEKGEKKWASGNQQFGELREKLDSGWGGDNAYPGFLFQSSDSGVSNSYTFIGNHDKPRVLHCLSLDMGLFHHSKFLTNKELADTKALLAELNDLESRRNNGETLSPEDDARLRDKYPVERKVIEEEYARNLVEKFYGTKFNDKKEYPSMALAMGVRLKKAFDESGISKDLNDKVFAAIKDLVDGKFKGKDFDANAFGTRPIEVAIRSVLDQVEYSNGGINIPNREDLEANILKSILEPSFDKFYSMYKMLITLPGSPTDFAGDKVGVTGYETKAKNYHQQNRNIIHWEWLSDDNNNKYSFIKNFYDKMSEIANLRTRKELSALNNGATVTIPVAKYEGDSKNPSYAMTAMLRYNDKSRVLVINDPTGINTSYDSPINRQTTEISDDKKNAHRRIILAEDFAGDRQGLKHGLKDGTVFKNARDNDNSTYKINRVIMDKNGNILNRADTSDDTKAYYILRRYDKSGKELPIKIKPEDLNTLILYNSDEV